MLKHARAGNAAILGDMADQHQSSAAFLGKTDQFLRRGTHLAHRSRRAFNEVAVHRLDRIDDEQGGRLCPAKRGQDIAHRCGRRQLHRRIAQPQPPRAQPYLIDRLLTRNIGNVESALCKVGRGLQQQGRFADPRIAAQQCRRSGHKAAA